MFSYPLQVHPCRASVDAALKWRPSRRPRSSNGDASPQRNSAPLITTPRPASQAGREMSDLRFAAISTAIIVLSYIVAMTVSSLEKVLAYVGSTGSTTISFILPGLFYYKISDPDSPHHQRLVKADDDEEYDEDAAATADPEEDVGHVRGGRDTIARQWRRGLLRKMSLVLAIYGVVVMCTCLATNAFLMATH